MKNIIVLMVLILVTSGCSNFQKTTQSEQQTQSVSECPSCKDECRKQCDEEIADAQKPYKHEIDLEEEKCLKNAYSTADMRKCAYDAMDAWFLVIDKDMNILKEKLSSDKYQAIVKSQKQWKQYQEIEFDANNKAVLNKGGTYYYVISVDMKTNMVKERAMLLDSYISIYSE